MISAWLASHFAVIVKKKNINGFNGKNKPKKDTGIHCVIFYRDKKPLFTFSV